MKKNLFFNKNKSMQDIIFECTKGALRGKTVSKKIKPLGDTNDEEEWVINGFDRNIFVFHTADYGKKVKELVIFAIVKDSDTKKEIFNDEKFVRKMYNLFLNKEKEMLKQKLQQTQKNFIEQFKSNIK